MVGILHRKIIRPLLQEIYQPDGWKMLTCCMLLNLTNRKQVDTIRDELFSKYPTPKDMMNANQSELAELLKPLGLYNRRAKSLKKMSEGYVKGFKSVDELYGIGQYAKDSWEIFQNNNRNVNPTDKVLLAYLDMEM
jgi:methyl-CpG-binding domain protein 4|tara:strand:+ start:399 stop:806 length:408 start_codon:yes stop_codon:yes gene_type:complete